MKLFTEGSAQSNKKACVSFPYPEHKVKVTRTVSPLVLHYKMTLELLSLAQ